MNPIHSPPVKKPPLWCAITTGNGTSKATVNQNNSGHFPISELYHKIYPEKIGGMYHGEIVSNPDVT